MFSIIVRHYDTAMPFEFGENEKVLLNYLGNHGEITVNIFCAVGNIGKQLASQTLIKLTVNNVLKIIPDEKEDKFIFID